MNSGIYIRKSVPEGLAEIIRCEIAESRKPGDALESVHAFARRFGVSVATIRNTLLILSKDGLIESIHGSGTYVREQIAPSHVAVLTQMDVSSFRTNYYFWRVIQKSCDFLDEKGIAYHCYTGFGVPGTPFPSKLSLDFMHALEKGKIRGVLSVGVCGDVHLPELLARKKIPLAGEPTGACFVELDSNQLISMGLEALARQGRKKIGYFSYAPQKSAVTAHFKNELDRLGLSTHEAWIKNQLVPGENGGGWIAFKQMWAGFREKPDGLLVTDDFLFNDVFMALIELGIDVPDQLAIATHSNRGSGIRYPMPITYLEVDPDEYVELTGNQFVRVLNGEAKGPLRATLPIRICEGLGLQAPNGVSL